MTLILMSIVAVLGVWLTCSAVAADPVAEPDAAALIRDMRSTEAWFDELQSFEIELESVWTKTEEALARRRAELKTQFPGLEPTPESFPELRPTSSDSLHLAFDTKRVTIRHEGLMGPGTFDNRVWDGTRAINHARYSARQEFYSFDTKPDQFFRNFLGHLMWLRAAPHAPWFIDKKCVMKEEALGRPDDFGIVGRELFHGADCYVLQKTPDGHSSRLTRWYVGVQDHRPYGKSDYSESKARVLTVVRELATKHGQTAMDETSLRVWSESLSGDRRTEITSDLLKRAAYMMVQSFEQWCLNYREVAPGRFVPMAMGYSFFNTDGLEARLDSTREMKVTKVTVDEPLNDALFRIEFEDGIDVNDWGHQPPLFYKYKKDWTPEEWQAIVDAANQRAARDNAAQEGRDQLIGQPAPEFPQTQWLHSDPLSLADLKGKVVLIDFFSESCGTCRNDLPTLVQLHKNREAHGLLIIGIHLPGSEMPAVENLIKNFGIEYPICMDTPSTERWGTLFAAYRVDRMPYTVVLDRDGNIAGHGSLGEVLAKAHHLAEKPSASP